MISRRALIAAPPFLMLPDRARGMAMRSALPGSGPITVTQNGQVISGLAITSSSGDAIVANGFSNIIIQNCLIKHAGGRGINASNCPGISISNCNIINVGAPPNGANSANTQNNIELTSCNNAIITQTRVQDGSAGIYLNGCSGAALSFIEGHNARGPMSRGQLVQFNACSNSSLTDFSVSNDLNTCWTEDCVSVFHSTNITIARGLIDGNNSPSGGGVSFDTSIGTCADVDAINWSNGAFGASNCMGVSFTRCRARDSYSPCSQGRGAPSSGSLAFASINGCSGTIFSACQYFNLVAPGNIIFDSSTCAQTDATQNNFARRNYQAVSVPWW